MQNMINQVKNEVRKVCKDSTVTFVKESEQRKSLSRKYDKSGIFHETKYRLIEVYVDHQKVKTRKVHLFIKVEKRELTCPAEENYEGRHSENISRYEDLLKDCVNAGWKVHLFTIKVGAREQAACLLRLCLSRLRFV